MPSRTRNSAKNKALSAPGSGSRVVYVVMALIALCGLADATFLTVMHLTGDDSLCGPSSGCSTVLSSAYASVRGIPTAAFGIVAYFAAFSAAVCSAFGYPKARGFLACTVAVMFLATLGFLYLQAFVLHAFCPFCLLSAALTFLLAGIIVATLPAR